MLCLREIAIRSTGEELAQAASTYLGEQRRRSTRLEQTSPLIIRGVDLLGQPFEERTATQNLSFQGCRYASKHHLPKNTWVTLEAPSGDSRGEAVCARARVAWIQRPRTLRELFQVGVELEKPRNIWNVEFPPGDWTSERPPELSIVRPASADVGRQESGKEVSLEDYLRRAAVFRNQETGPFVSGEWDDASGTLMGQLRHEFLRQSEKLIEETRAKTDERIAEKVGELALELQSSHAASTKAFYEQAQAMRHEVRADIEANARRGDERLNEKLAEIRRELEAALQSKAVENTATEPDKEGTDSEADNAGAKFDSAREQWNELVENSIESAARRFAERITSSSLEVLRNSEQDLARHAADLQKDAGITAEAARAALDEVKSALEREVSAAKDALKQIEQSAFTYAEYSQQLEAASHDALEDLRCKLGSAVADKFREMEQRAAELEVKFAEHADLILGQRVGEASSRNCHEIEASATAGLARIKSAMEEFAASEESAENMLQIRRERLRQFAEQVQREEAARLSSDLVLFEKDLDEKRSKKLETWTEQLAAGMERARNEAFRTLTAQVECQLGEAGSRLAQKAEQSIESAREHMHSELHAAGRIFQTEIEKRQANQMEKAAEDLTVAAQSQVQSATAEFRTAAEAAASALGEMIVKADADALAKFSAAIEEQGEQGRARLISAGESALENIQAHAQTSFEHFQEQLAIKADLSVQKASEMLNNELGVKMDNFRSENEKMRAEWRINQESSFAQIFDESRKNIEAAANSVIEADLERLREHSQKRIGLASQAAEQAVHQACADVFETIAQKMRQHVQEFGENKTNSAQMEQQDHHAPKQ